VVFGGAAAAGRGGITRRTVSIRRRLATVVRRAFRLRWTSADQVLWSGPEYNCFSRQNLIGAELQGAETMEIK